MGNGGPVCHLVGSGDCDNCDAKRFKLKVIPYKGPVRTIYKIVSKW